MIRVEIIANHSIEENILEAFQEHGVGKYYTKYPNIIGVGSSGPRMGDAVWPEENFAIVVWCDEEEALGIEQAAAQVKEKFPDEGVKVFGLPPVPAALAGTPAPSVPPPVPAEPERPGSPEDLSGRPPDEPSAADTGPGGDPRPAGAGPSSGRPEAEN
jgi:hypothetical protein